MADITFYTNPQSRGQIARWAMEEAGAQYDEILLDYGTTMKGEEYLAINPMGKVPAIVHRGKAVTECAAICAYLAEAYPDADLAPRADERADYYRWLFFAAGPIEQAVLDRFMKVEPDADQQLMAGYGTYERATSVLADAVAARPYITGDRFTMADVYVGSQVIWGTQFGTLPKYDAFIAYVDRLTSRDMYRQAKAKDVALMPAKSAE